MRRTRYFDFDDSGTYKLGYTLNGASPDRGVERVRPFVEWLKQHNLRGIITEFGVPNDDPRWLELVQRLLVYWRKKIFRGCIGPAARGGETTHYVAEPKNGVNSPIMAVLTKHYRSLRK